MPNILDYGQDFKIEILQESPDSFLLGLVGSALKELHEGKCGYLAIWNFVYEFCGLFIAMLYPYQNIRIK